MFHNRPTEKTNVEKVPADDATIITAESDESPGKHQETILQNDVQKPLQSDLENQNNLVPSCKDNVPTQDKQEKVDKTEKIDIEEKNKKPEENTQSTTTSFHSKEKDLSARVKANKDMKIDISSIEPVVSLLSDENELKFVFQTKPFAEENDEERGVKTEDSETESETEEAEELLKCKETLKEKEDKIVDVGLLDPSSGVIKVVSISESKLESGEIVKQKEDEESQITLGPNFAEASKDMFSRKTATSTMSKANVIQQQSVPQSNGQNFVIGDGKSRKDVQISFPGGSTVVVLNEAGQMTDSSGATPGSLVPGTPQGIAAVSTNQVTGESGSALLKLLEKDVIQLNDANESSGIICYQIVDARRMGESSGIKLVNATMDSSAPTPVIDTKLVSMNIEPLDLLPEVVLVIAESQSH